MDTDSWSGCSLLDSVDLVSEQSLEGLLRDPPEEYPVAFQIESLSKFIDGSLSDDEVVLVDLNAFSGASDLRESEFLTNPTSTIALVVPGELENVRILLDRGVRIFLRRPIGSPELIHALKALRKDRRYLDPSLSDSLVEYFIE